MSTVQILTGQYTNGQVTFSAPPPATEIPQRAVILLLPDSAPERPDLKPRELQVIAGVAAGLTNQQIAEQIGLGLGTVRNLLSAVMRKLGLPNRAAVASLAWQAAIGAEVLHYTPAPLPPPAAPPPSSPATQSFAIWLQEQLDARNWNKADLARASGLSYESIWEYFRGRRPSATRSIRALAQALDVEIATILGLLADE